MRRSEVQNREHTDVKTVVIPTEAVNDGLLRRSLVLDDPVWTTVWNRLRRRLSSNAFLEWLTSSLCAEIE